MFKLRGDKRFFVMLIKLIGVCLLINLLLIKKTFAATTTNSNRNSNSNWKTQLNTLNIPPAPYHDGNRMLPANSFSKRQLMKSTKGNTHPPLFWSYYSNAARTVEKVSTEQGLDSLIFPYHFISILLAISEHCEQKL